MKKVISITLGGVVFAIEEEAYAALTAYLTSIERAFSDSDDYAEISTDIEGAIAEKFMREKKNEKRAVTMADVEMVIAQMGHAEDFAQESGGSVGAQQKNEEAHTEGGARRLYRDTDEAIIGGVCSGLASYFAVDPVIVRVIFVVLAFANGIGILLYLLLWLIVPAAETPAQKYAMRGERMTISQITSRVKKKIDDIDPKEIERARGVWVKIRELLVQLFEALGFIARALLKFLRYLVGIAFVLFGAISIAGLVSIMSAVWFSGETWAGTEFGSLVSLVLTSPSGYVFFFATMLTALIPIIVIMMAGASFITGKNVFTIRKSVILGVIWLVAVPLTATLGAMQAPAVRDRVDQFDQHIERLVEEQERIRRGGDSETSATIEVYDGIFVPNNIRELDLSGMNLSGSLKAEVRLLQELNVLNLEGNSFTGLPAEIGQLKDLNVLNLRNNNFTGLPHELGNLDDLATLDLRGNDISTSDLAAIRSELSGDTEILVD